jgi:N-methylhydantoinase A
MGFFMAPLAFDTVRSFKVSLERANFSVIEQLYKKMEEETSAILGSSPEQPPVFTRGADMRYVGQGYEIHVPMPNRDFRSLTKADVQSLYDEAYTFLYGRVYPDVRVEFMSFRLSTRIPMPQPTPQSLPPTGDLSKAVKGYRRAYDETSASFIEYPVYDRYQLFAGAAFKGPAIVEEKETTIVATPQTALAVDQFGTTTISL